jgi:hypothetical protein
MSKTETIAAEVFEERSAICEHDGLLTREQAEAQGKLEADEYRMACEVRTVLAMPFVERNPYLQKVQLVRGLAARDVLAKAINDEWIRRKAK